MEPVELTDGRVLLRLPSPSDVDAVTEACQDAETQRWIPVPVPYEREDATEYVQQAAGCWAADGELRWAVTEAESGRLVGALSLHAHGEGMREIGYWTAPWARGQGLTTGAARLACRWGFESLGLARLLQRGDRQDAWVGGLLPEDLR